ncbi:hypothetical protein OG563_30515 [Nocardia vinacea]|uniref:Uncharacterized protein n=1 Tax=Nocardia vinacea TaxID=96468 RepID=A0ABZ1YJY2_9NOCA|nr:hypothetical protein [Nocardia vinacea]
MSSEFEFEPTQWQYYNERGAVPMEDSMRADFTRAYQLRKTAGYAETATDREILLGRADAIAYRWTSTGVEGHWRRLQYTVDSWERSPHRMSEQYDRIADAERVSGAVMAPINWRHQQQARELTGHGAWLARHTPDIPVPVFGRRRCGIERSR